MHGIGLDAFHSFPSLSPLKSPNHSKYLAQLASLVLSACGSPEVHGEYNVMEWGKPGPGSNR